MMVEGYQLTPNRLEDAHPSKVTKKAKSLGTTPQKILKQSTSQEPKSNKQIKVTS